MTEITTEQAMNLAKVLAKWHVEWMRLRHEALSMPDSEGQDFLMSKFPTIQGTANNITFEKFGALPCDERSAWKALRAFIEAENGKHGLL